MGSTQFGAHAVVIGAGMAGSAAACAVSAFFERVTLLERDDLPAQIQQRRGIPQGRHLHGLLAGGCEALASLAPGIGAALLRLGAVPLVVGRDQRIETPGYDPFPRRDLGISTFCASRPLFEHALRSEVLKLPNITLTTDAAAVELTGSAQRVTGVVIGRGAEARTIPADLVIDASGRGELTLAFLNANGIPAPDVTSVDASLAYSTMTVSMSAGGEDWLSCSTLPDRAINTRGGLLMPIEGDRYMLTLAARVEDAPPAEPAAFRDYMQGLRTSTIADAVRGKEFGEIVRFRFNASYQRHFERLETFPLGLLPIGDSICRFNPVYGQGMSVGAQQAVALREILHSLAGMPTRMQRLWSAFFERVVNIVKAPWQMSTIADLAHGIEPGDRPAQLARMLAAAQAIERLAADDPLVHKLHMEVAHLLRPSSAYLEGRTGRRVLEKLGSALAV